MTLWSGPGQDDVVRVVETDKANLVERSHLRFPHEEHLRQSIRGPKGRVNLECKSCHVPDVSGKAFEPISMQKHCLQCHTLEFEPAVTSRQVPHGSANEAMLTMQEFYASIALNNIPVDTIDTGEIRRAIPRPSGGTLTEEERKRALAWARAKAQKVAQDLFEARVCIVCHEIVRKAGPGGGDDIMWGVAPVRIATAWLPKADFDHDRHRTYKCSDCHDKVAKSTKSSDVNIPDIETCRVCHAGNVRAAKKEVSTCGACHGFHLPGHPPMHTSAKVDVQRPRCRGFRVGRQDAAMTLRRIATVVALALQSLPAAEAAEAAGRADARRLRRRRPTSALTIADVQQVIAQAVTEAQAHNAKATIAVVDRVGNVLGVFRMNGAAAMVTITSNSGATGGLEGVSMPVRARRIGEGDHRRVPVVRGQRVLDAHGEPDHPAELRSGRGESAVGAAFRRPVQPAVVLRRQPARDRGHDRSEALAARACRGPGRPAALQERHGRRRRRHRRRRAATRSIG